MTKKIIFIFIGFLFTLSLSAQTKCAGTVKNVYDEYISNASVIIKDTEGHIISFGFTDEKGHFSLNAENTGTFTIEVHKSGFVKEQQELIINKNTKNYKLDFVLVDTENILEDLVIDIPPPVMVSGDTISYDAKAFTTGREQTVEDLLKNIPGLSIDSQGNIKYGETPIEKVMVGGDDLFNKGYALLTKNMPNKPLDKVQVLRNYSNNKLLKGIEESDGVALNLTLDEDYKDLWFGDISAGYGLVTENRYDVTSNLMNFSKNYKAFLNVGLNNVGIDRIGSIDNMFYGNNEIESIRVNSASQLMGLSGGRAGQLKDHRTRINNAESVSLSVIVPVSEKLKIKTVGFLNFDENYVFNNRYSVTSVGDTYFENTENNQFKSHLNKFYVNLLATYDLSKTQMLEVSSVWNQGTTNNYNDLTFNGVNTLEQLKTRNTFIDQKATYTHQWKGKNAVLLKARYFTNKIPQLYNIDDYLMGGLFPFDADAMNNDIQSEKTFAGLEADFKLRQNNNDLIEFQVGYKHNEEAISAFFQLFDNGTAIRPDGFQTQSSFIFGDLYARSGYTWKWTNFSISGRAEAHQLFNKFTSLESDKTQNPFYINPRANFKWDMTPLQSISGGYSINFMNVSAVNVNDTYLLQSSRSFSKGLGDFTLTDSQMANLMYSYRHYLARYGFSFAINYSKQNNVLSSRTALEQNSSLSESILIKGGETYSFTANSNYYLRRFMRSSFKISGMYSASTYFNEINDLGLRKNNIHNQSYKFEWATAMKNSINFRFETDWRFTKVKSPDFTNSYNNVFSYIELFHQIGNLELKTVTEHYYFGNLDKDNRNHYFIDFESSYTIKENYIISLRANNILDKKDFTTYNISDIGYSTMSYSLMRRYILLSLKFRF